MGRCSHKGLVFVLLAAAPLSGQVSSSQGSGPMGAAGLAPGLAPAVSPAAVSVVHSITGPEAVTSEEALGTELVRTTYDLVQLGVRVVDQRSVRPDGSVARATFDADGMRVDLDALRAADHALGLQRRGGMAPGLWSAVESLADGSTLEVAFWLREPEDGVDVGAHLRELLAATASGDQDGPDQVRAARRESLALARARYEAGNAGFAATVQARGGEVVLVADAWPVVIARVDAGQARELAADVRVDEAYQSQPQWFEEGNFAQRTMRTPTVWNQQVQANGNVKVMVNDTAQVQLDNPFLPPVIAMNSAGLGSHATSVAGNIANMHQTYKAAAHKLPMIYTAGGSGDSAAPPIWSNAVDEGIDFGNCSWWNGQKGSIVFLDRFFDHTIRNFGVMMFKSTGNQGNSSTPYTTTPGNGYNTTNSGAYSDNDNHVWGNDEMATSSSYWDPLEGHEKPEVASPGTGVTTTGIGSSGLTSGFGGTSSASPLTTGVAALLASNETELLAQMTTVKAILMASAWHNVEGEPTLSEKDGAGSIHAGAAWAVARDRQWWYDDVVSTDFPHGARDIPIEVDAGDDMRVVALWFSNPNDALSTDVLDMDLDMTVLDPDGNVIAQSLSATNPFEIAAFRTTLGGTYTVRLNKMRFDGDSEPLTVAWSSKSDTAAVRVFDEPFGEPFGVGKSPRILFESPYAGAFRTYIAAASLTPLPGVRMPGGYTAPLAYDFVTEHGFAQASSIGQLTATGIALVDFPLPDEESLVGWDIWFAMVVLGDSGPGDVLDVSDPKKFVVQP